MLAKDRTRQWLVEALDAARQRHHFDLWAWVIMPEHVHLLIHPRRMDYQIDKILFSIKRPVGYRAIAWLKQHAPSFLPRLTVVNRNRTYHHFWQVGPGCDNNLYKPPTVHQAIEYIHNNPVRRGLAATPLDWLWSSARDWAGYDDLLIRVDRTVPMQQPDQQ